MTSSPAEFASVVWFWMSVVGLIVAFKYIYAPAVVGTFRECMFELRRELFLAMSAGIISPDNKAYRDTRDSLNAVLRFAERFTLVRTVLLSLAAGRTLRDLARADRPETFVDDPEAKALIERINRRIAMGSTLRIVFGSPVLLPLVLIAYPLAHTSAALKSCIVAAGRWAQALASTATTKAAYASPNSLRPPGPAS